MEIAEVLNIPVSSFFDTTQGKSDESASADPEMALQGRQLLVAFMRIKDPQKRRSLLAHVRSLIETE